LLWHLYQNLLNKWSNFFKRLIDLTLTFIFGILASPFLLLIMALICLDSPGGIFYKQKRVGCKGCIFKMWKFRTMVMDADQVLQSLLDSNPEMKSEWEPNQKLKNDPRITRVGKFLRRFSLDEIPQLINVIKGEMSLVGPRPYFPEQQEIYGEGTKLYHRVRPGMTGMWQIRGRNTTTFTERARLDEYYIRNWSVWLDIYILLRTVLVVLSKEGAY
jgi:Undecaprenyl-phosphate galactose phosphotransferase WbaP